MSSDDDFEDTYDDITDEEAVGPLEIENTDIIQATMPNDNENKPNKSICKSLSTHLGLLKSRVNELSTFLDEREARQTICLLYTSPSPRDQRGSRMPSSA